MDMECTVTQCPCRSTELKKAFCSTQTGIKTLGIPVQLLHNIISPQAHHIHKLLIISLIHITQTGMLILISSQNSSCQCHQHNIPSKHWQTREADQTRYSASHFNHQILTARIKSLTYIHMEDKLHIKYNVQRQRDPSPESFSVKNPYTSYHCNTDWCFCLPLATPKYHIYTPVYRKMSHLYTCLPLFHIHKWSSQTQEEVYVERLLRRFLLQSHNSIKPFDREGVRGSDVAGRRQQNATSASESSNNIYIHVDTCITGACMYMYMQHVYLRRGITFRPNIGRPHMCTPYSKCGCILKQHP